MFLILVIILAVEHSSWPIVQIQWCQHMLPSLYLKKIYIIFCVPHIFDLFKSQKFNIIIQIPFATESLHSQPKFQTFYILSNVSFYGWVHPAPQGARSPLWGGGPQFSGEPLACGLHALELGLSFLTASFASVGQSQQTKPDDVTEDEDERIQCDSENHECSQERPTPY